MMCFRDMQFCAESSECEPVKYCLRQLTSEVVLAAQRWWGGPDAPIAQGSFKATCNWYKEKEK